jgi:hypothetical protein
MMASHHFLSGRTRARPLGSVNLFAAQTCRSACCVFGLFLGTACSTVATVGGLRYGWACGLVATTFSAVVMRKLGT